MAIKKRSATVVPGASGAAAAVKNPQASKSSFWGELPQHVMSDFTHGADLNYGRCDPRFQPVDCL